MGVKPSALFYLSLLAVVPACHLYENDAPCPCSDGWTCCPGAHVCAETPALCPAPEGPITFHQIKSMAGAMPVAGIDSDGDGGLWIAYHPDGEVHVVHLDASGATLSDWPYTDAVSPIHGLAYTGNTIWLDYAGITPTDDFLRVLDANSGSELKRYATDYAMSDVSGDPSEVLAIENGDLLIMDPATGGVSQRVVFTGFHAPYYSRGVTAIGSRFAIAAWNSNTIYLVGRDGAIQEAANTDSIATEALHDVFLAWDGSALIVESGNQIRWLAPDSPL